MKQYQSACPLDCWDACSILVKVDGQQQASLSGDPTDPITQGFLCRKGQQMLERFNHPDRLTSPLKRVGEGFETISWDQALDEIADKLRSIQSTHGSSSLIHYSEGGHGGLAKNIDTAFFNELGGATTPRGSLCWSAGIAAQKLDFGNSYCHSPEDMANTQCLILWGRNPSDTNIHLVPFVKKVRKAGVPVYLIDPVNSTSRSLADHHLALKPGSDGHLALALAKAIVEKGQHDSNTEQHSLHFKEYLAFLETLNFNELVKATGLAKSQVLQLAETYGTAKSATIYLGYGIQRNHHGGRNVRLIDALAALTGNIGIPGGGVNYAHRNTSQWVDGHYLENARTHQAPTFPRSHFSDYVLGHEPGQLQGIFVTKANPAVQLPDTFKVAKAFEHIPFKVVIDHFMTDTARLADYVLPPTMILEEEDIIFSSMWHNRFTWTEKALEPPKGVLHEFHIFQQLARRLEMKNFIVNYPDILHYLSRSVGPLCDYLGLSSNELRGRRMGVPGHELPWEKHSFETPSGRFTFYVPETDDFHVNTATSSHFPYRMLSVHRPESLHSQHMRTLDEAAVPKVTLHPATAREADITEGSTVRLTSSTGFLTCRTVFDEGLQPGLLLMKEGTWLKNGTVNQLTRQAMTDIGEQVAYHDCYCRVEKL